MTTTHRSSPVPLRIGVRLVAASVLALATQAFGAQYTIVDLNGYEATDINNIGQVVGSGYVTGGSRYPFLVTPAQGVWFVAGSGGSNALMQNLGTLGRGNGTASSINNSGAVVGYTTDGTPAFLWDATGGMRDLLLAPSDNYAQKISDSGLITGRMYLYGGGGVHAFGGSEASGFIDLNVASGANAFGFGVNAAGQYVGTLPPGSSGMPQKAYLWQNNTTVDLGFLTNSDVEAIAYAISDHRQIVVGTSGSTDGATTKAFVLVPRDVDGDGVLDFNDKDADPKNDLMVNISGSLAGSYRAVDLNEHGDVVFRIGSILASPNHSYLVKPADTNSDGIPDTWFINDGTGKNKLAEEIPPSPGCSNLALTAINDLDMMVGVQTCNGVQRAVLVLPPPPWFAPADFDKNFLVDARDLTVFKACTTGPGLSYQPVHLPPGCTLTPDPNSHIAADFDQDGDVDQDDFGGFQRCYSGVAGADPNCR